MEKWGTIPSCFATLNCPAPALFRAFSQGTGHRVSEAQFITCMQLLLRGTPEERATFMFRVFDRDGDGRLEKRELWDVVAFCRDSVELPDDKLEEAWATMGGGQVGSVRREDFERFIIPMLHQEAESAEKLSRTDALPLTFGSPDQWPPSALSSLLLLFIYPEPGSGILIVFVMLRYFQHYDIRILQ